MKNFIYLSLTILFSLFFTSAVFAQCEGNVYFTSLTWQTANSVQGFSSTELDYCAGLYYDPALSGNLTEGYGTANAIIGQGYTEGYADVVPAALDFGYAAPVNNLSYTTNGAHYVIAYYQVYVAYWNDYYWYDPWNLGFGEAGGGNDGYYAPDYSGYWSYVSYWTSSQQYVGSSSHTITYTGQTQCLPGQQFTSTGQPCSNPNECQNNQQFTLSGQLCPNYVPPPEPPEQPYVTVHVFDQPLLPKDAMGYAKGPSTGALTRTCISGASSPAGQQVTLQILNVSEYTAGHVEAYHIGPKPVGKFSKSTGVTDGNGCFATTYYPSPFSGKYKIKSTISGFSNETDLWVVVDDLQKIPDTGVNYRLVGGGPEDCNAPSCYENNNKAMNNKYAKAHPSDHYVVPESIPGLVKIANDYKAQFYPNGIQPSQMVAYNDASLWFGGKFDLPVRGEKADWREGAGNYYPHVEHRLGHNVDMRVDPNIPNQFEEELINICVRNNFGINDERGGDAPHLHLDWNNPNRRTGRGRVSLLQNGIDQNAAEFYGISLTPSSFVTNAGETILDRQITQQEFESWFQQMSNAKAQGQNVFLQEVKTFEKQLFASQEYVARQRTDEQFVGDVFTSHLFRDPTDEELTYWMDYLSNIGGSQPIDSIDPESPKTRTTIPLSQTQKRQIFLNNFENLPDFVNLVGNIGDDIYQEQPH